MLACLFLMTGTVMAKIVKGRVIDSSDKEPIVGASIFVKSTKQGTITDIEGHFSLEIPDNVKTITVSFVGMTTREVAITPGEMTIELTAESQALEPVLSQNIIQSQMPINNQLITIIIKSKYYRTSLAISIFGCIFGCRISNTPSHEHQTKHHFCT